MKLEDQVAPLELARRMKELGFPQDTLAAWFARTWHDMPDKVGKRKDGVVLSFRKARDLSRQPGSCAAPTVAEMGEWLPVGFDSGSDADPVTDVVEWRATMGRRYGDPVMPIYGVKSEAEARARLLIALAESGALDPATLK